jgi:hypothetical protein
MLWIGILSKMTIARLDRWNIGFVTESVLRFIVNL